MHIHYCFFPGKISFFPEKSITCTVRCNNRITVYMYMYQLLLLYALCCLVIFVLFSKEIYDLMLDCWVINPKERPKACEIHQGLKTWTPELSAQVKVRMCVCTCVNLCLCQCINAR